MRFLKEYFIERYYFHLILVFIGLEKLCEEENF